MKIKTYGTRGSVPIARGDSAKYGGNTTSLRIFSRCIPEGTALVIDAGSGYIPLSYDLLTEGIMNVAMMLTHYHHDHTQGFPLAPHTYAPDAKMKVWGPRENGIGPQEVFSAIMKAPVFPMDYAMVRNGKTCKPLMHIGTQVLAVHHEGGFTLIPINVYQESLEQEKQLPFGKNRFPVDECLIIKMLKAVHPEYTVSYRLEEMPTGKVFVFLTDHENTDGFSSKLLSHIKGAHLLIQDCQYSRKVYEAMTAGWGHGTPDYCVNTAIAGGISRIGITHHDVMATDEDIDQRVAEARACVKKNSDQAIKIFACADYGEYEV